VVAAAAGTASLLENAAEKFKAAAAVSRTR